MHSFQDSDVDQARRNGGVVTLAAGRRLLLPRVFGFCGGVAQALALLRRCLSTAGGRPVCLLGPVIHNDTVNDHFRAQGVTILDETEVPALRRPGSADQIVVIPAFGVPVEVEASLRRSSPSAQIIDTTCRDVRAVWEFMEALEGDDWTILIHGKADHPETRATLSRALQRAPRVVIVPGLACTERVCQALRQGRWEGYPSGLVHERGAAPLASGPVALVNQTTMLYGETLVLGAALREACEQAGRRCQLADTVCRATQDRQDAAVEVCRQRPDLVLVVGGFGSSNTAQLYRLASAAGHAYLVQDAEALEPDRITHWVPGSGPQQSDHWLPEGWMTVGILAGASCPAADVGKVIRWFRRLDRSAIESAVAAVETGREQDLTRAQEGKNGGSDETRTRDLRRDRPAL